MTSLYWMNYISVGGGGGGGLTGLNGGSEMSGAGGTITSGVNAGYGTVIGTFSQGGSGNVLGSGGGGGYYGGGGSYHGVDVVGAGGGMFIWFFIDFLFLILYDENIFKYIYII